MVHELDHPLDRPIWTALTTRQSAMATGAGGILRYDPAFGPFAASADGTPESLRDLAAFVPEGGQVYLQQAGEPPALPGLTLVRAAVTVQMVAERIEKTTGDFAFEVLTEVDGPDMLALARLTKPGPFAEKTHQLGRFVGVRHNKRLIAMAGERMKPGRFTEVSGVCTHPDHRGKGYAAMLMREVGRTILERGETPFLHAFANNVGAIALYKRLGFVTRWEPVLTVLQRV